MNIQKSELISILNILSGISALLLWSEVDKNISSHFDLKQITSYIAIVIQYNPISFKKQHTSYIEIVIQ